MYRPYSTNEWKKLDKLERGEILLLIEKEKKMAEIDLEFAGLEIFELFGLKKFNCPKELFHLVNSNDLLQIDQRWQKIIENENDSEWLTFFGENYNYPKCCANRFVNTIKTMEDIIDRTINAGQTGKIFKKWQTEIVKHILDKGEHPKEFNYLPNGFVPCSLHCENAIDFLKTREALLEEFDPEAAKAFTEFNSNWFLELTTEVNESGAILLEF